ncbi:MAG: lysostaphin resistance A-like protein [Candidatus Dormibacteria bacterium]
MGVLLALPGVAAAYLIPSLVVLGLHQAGVVRAIRGPGWRPLAPYYSFVVTLAFYGVLLLIVLFIAGRRAGRPWGRLGFGPPPVWLVILMPPLALFLQFVTGILSEILSPLLGGIKNPQGCDISQAFGADPYLAVISLAVIAPLVEEVVFRGFIYGALRRRFGVTLSVVVSSVIFALAHTFSVGGSIVLLGPSLFIAGVALALVYERSRSLVPGMVLHASFNLIAVAAIFLVGTNAACH